MPSPVRVAMWSGPRNISTAMMRSWENRGDTAVWDEPLYAYYLARTGIDHPMAAEVVAAGETDWRRVVERLVGPVPDGQPVFFQKHMTHHLLDEVDRAWLAEVTNCFLIRDPREVIASYWRARASVTAEDVGIPQQADIYRHVERTTGRAPLVVDARDVLENPRGMLSALCGALGVPFTERMLSWPPGPRASDGVWAAHWYASVRASSGFAPYVPKVDTLPPELAPLAAACEPSYRWLHARRLTA
ncbi:MAG: HAD family hydrolase [Ectothiorhodospiraceae bacterium]|nr:HAD family hydrolase [Chromatiales bacterium]MCP5153650.1 HAD family hydrolase [Ectothiorhodospiraceae bacterium]